MFLMRRKFTVTTKENPFPSISRPILIVPSNMYVLRVCDRSVRDALCVATAARKRKKEQQQQKKINQTQQMVRVREMA